MKPELLPSIPTTLESSLNLTSNLRSVSLTSDKRNKWNIKRFFHWRENMKDREKHSSTRMSGNLILTICKKTRDERKMKN